MSRRLGVPGSTSTGPSFRRRKGFALSGELISHGSLSAHETVALPVQNPKPCLS